MVDRERARGSIEVIDSSRFTGMRLEADWALAYALRGATRVSIADLECTLEAGQLLRLDDVRGERFDVVALDRAARVALIRIHSS